VRLAPAIPLDELTEKQFSAQVYELARLFSWRRYHTWRSKHSPAGFPDEVLVRERVIFAELKTETGPLSGAQKEWIAALERAGVEVYVWRPHDLDLIAETLRKWAA
jgi:hypothetical protein